MDYELTLKIRNGKLLELMKKHGYKTGSDLSKASKIPQKFISEMLRLKAPIYLQDGYTLREPVRKLMNHFNIFDPADIIPEKHLHNPLEQNEFRAMVNQDRLLSQAGTIEDPANILEDMQKKEVFSLIKDMMPERYYRAIELQMVENYTLEEIGQELNVTRERARQMILSGIRKYNHPETGKRFENTYELLRLRNVRQTVYSLC